MVFILFCQDPFFQVSPACHPGGQTQTQTQTRTLVYFVVFNLQGNSATNALWPETWPPTQSDSKMEITPRSENSFTICNTICHQLSVISTQAVQWQDLACAIEASLPPSSCWDIQSHAIRGKDNKWPCCCALYGCAVLQQEQESSKG